MTPERHYQIGELFHRILAHRREERADMLDEVCKDDPDLRRDQCDALQVHAGGV